MRRALVATLVLLPLLPAMAEENMTPERRETVAKVRALYRERDAYAVAEYVLSLGDLPAVVKTCDALVFDLHDAKALPEMVAVGRAALFVLLGRAGDAAAAPDLAKKCRTAARAMAYNLGSFTWPGWGDPVGDAERSAGEDAARLCLRLVTELDEGAMRLSIAHWLVGAHHLAAGRRDDAAASFSAARDRAKEAKDSAGALMNDGYLALTGLLLGPGGEAAERTFEDAVAALRAEASEDAKFYADQILTARRALGK